MLEVDTIGRSCHDIAMYESHDDIAGILTEYKKRGMNLASECGKKLFTSDLFVLVPWHKKWKAFICCHRSGDLYSALPSASDRINEELSDSASSV